MNNQAKANAVFGLNHPGYKNASVRAYVASLKAHAERLAEALRQAGRDLKDIKTDCDTGEFEIDPQFAIDRITEALAAWEGAQK